MIKNYSSFFFENYKSKEEISQLKDLRKCYYLNFNPDYSKPFLLSQSSLFDNLSRISIKLNLKNLTVDDVSSFLSPLKGLSNLSSVSLKLNNN